MPILSANNLFAVGVQVAIAQQVYDYVDQRIRRLDKDLKAFDAELTKERGRQGLVSPPCNCMSCELLLVVQEDFVTEGFAF